MTEIIDLTVSPRLEIIEISSDREDTCPGRPSRTQENERCKRKKGRTSNCLANGNDVGSSGQPSRAHSLEIEDRHSCANDSSASHTQPVSQALRSNPSPTIDESSLFILDATAASIPVEETSPAPGHTETDGDSNRLLLPSHVVIFRDDEPTPANVIPSPKPNSDDDEYIEYLDYEDRKAPGLVRYFEVEGEASQSRPSVFKCKNCGAEGDHKTYECPIQICLTCGARDEHSTRSCPISKTCYTCGMKGHINKTCPNRFSAHTASSGPRGDCNRCGSTEHKANECPTHWRIYQYVNDEERILIMQSRGEKEQLATGEGGEGYIGREAWCYNCADTGHLGDDCDELPHPAIHPAESSAFGSHNVMSGPFCDLATEPVSVKRESRRRESEDRWLRLPEDWDADAPPVDVGKRGKNKDKEKLEKRFREQEDEAEDWFNGARNVKKRGVDGQVPPSGPGGKTLKFRLIKDGGHGPSPLSSSPTGANGPSLLARLSDTHAGRNRGKGERDRESLPLFENSLRIRGAAAERRNQDGTYAGSLENDWERRQDGWGKDRPGQGGSRRGHGPRYRGGYGR